jgi:hypothetical protein
MKICWQGPGPGRQCERAIQASYGCLGKDIFLTVTDGRQGLYVVANSARWPLATSISAVIMAFRGQGRKAHSLYLLSHKVRRVGGLHLEGAVVRPQIDRVGDACAATFVNLEISVSNTTRYKC